MTERRKPYTERGVKRLRCSRRGCTNRAEYQFQVCADGNVWRPLCRDCDLALNRLVLEWWGDDDVDSKVRQYATEPQLGEG